MENLFGIDWLDFTVTLDDYYEWGRGYSAICLMDKYVEKLYRWTDGYVSIDKFVESGGFNHWDVSYRWAGKMMFALFASQNNESMKNRIQVHITGDGVRELGTEYVFRILLNSYPLDIHVTRIDICYDDYNHVIPVSKLIRSFEKYLSGKRIISSNYQRDTVQIYTRFYKDVYKNLIFGSRGSSQYFRLYDKMAEQKKEDIKYWYRMELELRRETAQACADYIKEHFPDIQTAFRYFLNRMFRVLEKEAVTDSEIHNMSRLPMADWWKDFVVTEERAKVVYTKPSVERTVNDMLGYVESSLAPFMKTLIDIAPDRLDRILRTTGVEGQSKPKYRRLLKHYKFVASDSERDIWRKKLNLPHDVPLVVSD